MLKGFEDRHHAELYAKFRPTYPPEVAEKVVEYAKRNAQDGRISHLVDVGCGNGQSTMNFASYFEKVTAIDVSSSQIEEAKKMNTQSNVNYIAAHAEKLPVSDHSVDVICSGQAIHWVDFPKFWQECHRVMKPDGSLVLFGYDMPHIVPAGDVSSQLSCDALRQSARKLTINLHNQCKFHPRIDHVNNLYVDIFDLIPAAEKHRDDTLKIERHWSVKELGNYFSTWSGYQTYLRERDDNDSSPDVLSSYLESLKKLFQLESSENEDIQVVVTWDIFMLFSKRPMP